MEQVRGQRDSTSKQTEKQPNRGEESETGWTAQMLASEISSKSQESLLSTLLLQIISGQGVAQW